MKTVLIGFGEVGKGVYDVLSGKYEIEVVDPFKGMDTEGEFEMMLVCIPYTDDFLKTVEDYRGRFRPKSVIIFSTVPMGTSRKAGAVHSPVEGKHPNLAESIAVHARWVGGSDQTALSYLKKGGFTKIRHLPQPEFTEFLKLRSTSLYGVNIEFARYSKEVADKLGMDFAEIMEFDRDYNQLYKEMGMPHFSRYILTPPEGEIGGHCVVPNARLLDSQFPSIFLKKIYGSGPEQKQEVKKKSFWENLKAVLFGSREAKTDLPD